MSERTLEPVLVHLALPADLKRLGRIAATLVESERPFGLVLAVEGLGLDGYAETFPAVRDLDGGRARFGSWCSGVAYAFAPAAAAERAGQHLFEAPLVWGTRVWVAAGMGEAVAWADAQLRRYTQQSDFQERPPAMSDSVG